MLTLEESRPLLRYLRFWSKFLIFPFQVNASSGKLVELPKWKMRAWRTLESLGTLHCFYGLLALLNTLILRQDELILYHLPIQFDVTVVPCLVRPTIAIALVSNVPIVTKIFNELYNESVNNNEGRRHWSKMNIPELLGLGIPVVIMGVIVFFVPIICLQPGMSHLMINSNLLAAYKDNIGLRFLTYLIEIYSLAFWAINGGFLLGTSALVLAKVEAELEDLLANLRAARYTGEIAGALKASRKLQLFLQMFNGYNSWFIHGFKTNVILAAISNGYIGVRYRNDKLMTVFCCFIHLGCLITYCGVFRRAHRVVSGQMDVRREMKAASLRVRNCKKRGMFLLQMKSLRCIGIRVGQFHEIERNSAIIFVDYVERQLLSLLLTF